MNKRPVDTVTDAALRDLDPAPRADLTEEEGERAEAAFARIVASPRHHPAAPDPEPRRWRGRRLLVPAGLAGAAAGAAVPALLLGGGSAFASWTPTPEPLTAAAATEAAATCRAALQVPDRGEQVLVAERRGGWTYVLLAGPGAEGVCLMPDDLVGRPDPVEHKQDGFFGNYDPDPVEAPAAAPGRIVETGSTVGSVPVSGPWLLGDDEGWFSSVEGYAGSDVTGITVHTPEGTDVEASVANGRFAAWWPSEPPSSENLDVMGAWTYTVSLADGSTRRVAG